jgi:hypothetical protein
VAAVAEPPGLPDWRDAAGYAPLLEAEPGAMAWEWLRRDALYRHAARAARHGGHGTGLQVVAGDAAAARWGLHAFEEPALSAMTARPVWRRDHRPGVLVAAAERDGPADDRFDVARFAPLATIVCDPRGAEHLLLSDGMARLRLDVVAGSLLGGPVRLAYRLSGFAMLDGPLATLHALARFRRSGRLPNPPGRSRNRRLVLLLRTWDALQAGATQREIAGVLLSAEAAQARWRTEAPSLRLRAQRLAGGARSLARGGYRGLLRS